MNKICVEDLVDPEIRLIGICKGIDMIGFFCDDMFVAAVTLKKPNLAISGILFKLNMEGRSTIAINVTVK